MHKGKKSAGCGSAPLPAEVNVITPRIALANPDLCDLCAFLRPSTPHFCNTCEAEGQPQKGAKHARV